MTRAAGSGWEGVYRVVRRIPSGCVSTYGEVAALADRPGAARQVGWALNALGEDDDVPWHRVINAQGAVSGRSGERSMQDLQRALLESEGVSFDTRGRVDLERYRWSPRKRAAARPVKSGPKKKPTTSPKKRTRAGAKNA